jgi:hypothetical protein
MGKTEMQEEGVREQLSESPIFVSNVNYRSCENELLALFGQIGGIISVKILEDRNGRRNGTAIVKYKKRDSAIMALQRFNGFEFLGRTLHVSWGDEGGRRASAYEPRPRRSERWHQNQYVTPEYPECGWDRYPAYHSMQWPYEAPDLYTMVGYGVPVHTFGASIPENGTIETFYGGCEDIRYPEKAYDAREIGNRGTATRYPLRNDEIDTTLGRLDSPQGRRA